jgi:hypothetical protein
MYRYPRSTFQCLRAVSATSLVGPLPASKGFTYLFTIMDRTLCCLCLCHTFMKMTTFVKYCTHRFYRRFIRIEHTIFFQMLPAFVGNCKHTVSITRNKAIRQWKMVFSKYFNIFSLPVSLSLIVCLPYQAGLPTSYLSLPISLPFRRHFCLPNCMLACQWAVGTSLLVFLTGP